MISAVLYFGLEAGFKLAARFAGSARVPDFVLELAVSPLATGWTIWRALRRHTAGRWPAIKWSAEPAGIWAPFLVMIVGDAVMLSGVDNVMEALLPSPDWLRDLMGELINFAANPVSTVAMVVVMAPLCEEAIMRGVVLRGLLGTMRAGRAIAISALLFAAMHLNPWQMPTAFAGGLILGWVYRRTGSLGLCIVGHALHNALCLFAPSLPLEIPGFNTMLLPGQPVIFQPWWFTLGGVVVFCGGAWWFHRAGPER